LVFVAPIAFARIDIAFAGGARRADRGDLDRTDVREAARQPVHLVTKKASVEQVSRQIPSYWMAQQLSPAKASLAKTSALLRCNAPLAIELRHARVC
jgi:hypothetical protein